MQNGSTTAFFQVRDPALKSQNSVFNKVQKSRFFYKALSLTLANSEHHLGALKLSLEDYKANFLKNDDLLPSSQRDKMLENHPQQDELRAYLQQEGAPILDK